MSLTVSGPLTAAKPDNHPEEAPMNELMTRLTRVAAAGALGALIALPAQADDPAPVRDPPSKESNIGAATGLAIGALAGGPVGAIVGLGAGALVGNHYHRQLQAKQALKTDLEESEAQRVQLNADLVQVHSSLAQAEARGQALDQSVQRTDQVGLDVGFRTDDDSVTAQAMSPLLKLGALVASMPQAQVRVSGFADPRGSDTYNDELSLRRAENVAAVLVAAGVPRERIFLEAHGKTESVAAEGDADAYALERHVSVRLELSQPAQVARRD
jgi:outer membrane protein OmpA-like peptidoglycan-associated protein